VGKDGSIMGIHPLTTLNRVSFELNPGPTSLVFPCFFAYTQNIDIEENSSKP